MRKILGVPSSTTGIYLIRNLFDGKCYVGSSARSLVKRCVQHVRELSTGRHGNWHLSRAWKYGGPCAFEFSVIEVCAPEECVRREQYWMDVVRPQYNILPAAGSPLGYKHKPESIEKTRQAHIGSKRSEESRQRMSAAALGHKRCVGRVLSPETREKIRQGNLRREWRPPEGRKMSAESKAKMSASKRGKNASVETRRKMSETHKKRLELKRQNKKPVNVITYLRVSTEEQTVEPQRLELKSYCERQNWRIDQEYSDIISGSKAARPGLDAMLERCAAGGVDAIAIVKLDRIGRSVLNVAKLIERLDKMGVALICTTQGIDTRKNNPCGRLQLAMLSAVAAFERDLIRERTIAGMKVARASGKLIGKISPVAPKTNEERVAIVTKWYEETGGKGVRVLAKMMGGISISTAGSWATKYRAVITATDEMTVPAPAVSPSSSPA